MCWTWRRLWVSVILVASEEPLIITTTSFNNPRLFPFPIDMPAGITHSHPHLPAHLHTDIVRLFGGWMCG